MSNTKTAAAKLAEGLGADEVDQVDEKDTEKGPQDVEETTETPEVPETPETPEAPEEPAQDALTKPDGTPFTKTDLDGLQTALRAARKDAREALAEVATLKTKTGDRSVEQIEQEAATVAESTWKPRLVRQAARAAFAEAGLALPAGRETEAVARAVRLLDVDSLTVDDEGTVVGLAEQVDSLRSDFPDLFAGVANRRPPAINAGDRPAGAKPPVSVADRLAAQLTGR